MTIFAIAFGLVVFSNVLFTVKIYVKVSAVAVKASASCINAITNANPQCGRALTILNNYHGITLKLH